MAIEKKPNIRREISAGVIVYRKTEEGIKFLILYHGHNYWNFPKGKIEHEEESLAAALRETKEETGIGGRDVRLDADFRAHERFYFRRENMPIYKIVIFYLGETESVDVHISDEHNGYAWFLYDEAKRVLGRYRDSQRVMKQACEFLRQKYGDVVVGGVSREGRRTYQRRANQCDDRTRKSPRIYPQGSSWLGSQERHYRPRRAFPPRGKAEHPTQ